MKRLGATIALASLASIGWTATSAAEGHHQGQYGHGSDTSRSSQYGPGYQHPGYGQQQTPYGQQQTPYGHRPGTTTPTAAPYYATGEIGEEREEVRPNGPMLITGSTMLIGSYAATAVVAATSSNPADENLWIPVAGPWMDIAERRCGFGECGMNEDINQALLVGGGVTQGVGLALTLLSFVVPEQREERMPVTPVATKPTIKVAPVSFGRGLGIGAVGRF